MLKVAKKKGLTVSFDGNFRSTLWTWEEARDFCTECLPLSLIHIFTDGALLEKLYTEKISSRLAAFVQIQFLGSDIRVQKAAE